MAFLVKISSTIVSAISQLLFLSKNLKKEQFNKNTVTFVARKDTRSPGPHYKGHLQFSKRYQR